jgi:hypothetical protein
MLAPLALAAQDARLDSRLDAHTRDAVVALIDSARADGIPSEPLVQKALEGASKRADGARILNAVRMLDRELGDARAALGAASSDAEIIAGASALHAGIAPAALVRMRASRAHGSLTVALAVLSDLIARGVPGDTATTVISALTVAAGCRARHRAGRDSQRCARRARTGRVPGRRAASNALALALSRARTI